MFDRRLVRLAVVAVFVTLASCSAPIDLTPRRVVMSADPAFVPAETDKGWLIVKAQINGRGPFRFVVDTGASALYIRKESAARAGLRIASSSLRSRDAAGNTRRLRTTGVASLRLGDAEFHDLDGVVGDFPDWAEFDGLIGFGVFDDVTLTLDYENSRVGVSRDRLSRRDERAVSFTVEYAVPTVQGTIDRRLVDFLVDSGSQDFIAINEDDAWKHTFRGELRDSALVGTSTATFRQKSGRLTDDVRIGPVTIEAPIVAVDPSPTLIGARLLREFGRVHFDQRSRVMVLDDPADPGRGAERITMDPLRSTGVGLRRSRTGWLVRDVLPGSGASEAGVRVGDRLVRLNGIGSESMSERDLRELIRTQPALFYELERADGVYEVELEVDTLVP